MPTALRAAIFLLTLLSAAAQAAGEQRRATVWDLKLGAPLAAQPPANEFRAFACGSNGGAPRQQLFGWADFGRCRADGEGLREVYFEYDDELEYIARARDLPRDVARWAGTTHANFPIVVSALFADAGILKGIRIVTDFRPDYRNDTGEAALRKRADAYLLGGMLASRLDIDAAQHCSPQPPGEGETPVGTIFVKQACEKIDRAAAHRIVLRVSYYRKPGQSGVKPQEPTQLTQGQFESSTRLEIFAIGSP